MRVALIHNPGAGDDSNPGSAEIQQLIRAAGHEVCAAPAPDDDWTTVLGEDIDLVVVAGGDGTVGRVAKMLVGRDVPFTALPMGTANNISRTLGLVDKPVAELIATWQHSREVAFDIGLARGPWGERYFMEGFGAGLFACLMPEADANRTLASLRQADAKVAYALQMLRDRLDRCPPQRLDIRLDGRDLSGEYLLVEVMNMEYIGPNLYLAPACDLRDGLLDVVLVPASERGILEHYLSAWQNGVLWPPQLATYRGKRFEMRWTGFDVHIDDEMWPEEGSESRTAARSTIELTVLANAVRFLVPRQDSPL